MACVSHCAKCTAPMARTPPLEIPRHLSGIVTRSKTRSYWDDADSDDTVRAEEDTLVSGNSSGRETAFGQVLDPVREHEPNAPVLQVASTALASSVEEGATVLPAENTAGYRIGDWLRVGKNNESVEYVQISGARSLTITRPLVFPHSAGTHSHAGGAQCARRPSTR